MIKLRFDLPRKKKIILFDETHSKILKEIINKDFNILKVREEKEIYFWILVKQMFFFDFKFITYCKNYIKFVAPKVVITFIDTNIDFYELKNNLKNINFIAIQNGLRTADWFASKRIINSKNLNCDNIFVFNKHIIQEYKKYIKSNYHILGNFKNNIVEIKQTKLNNNFLFISQYNKTDKKFINFQIRLLKLLNLYFNNYKKKIYILLKTKNSLEQKEEIKFYKKFFKSNCVFKKSSEWKHSYNTLDSFENIISMCSTLGYEAIVRKKKIAVFSPNQIQGFKYNFGWPIYNQTKCNFFSTNYLSYNEVKRVLNNVSRCTQLNWKNKYYHIIENQMHFNKNNEKLKKIIFKLL